MKLKKSKKKILVLICTFGAILFLCLSVIIALSVSNNYQRLYKSPYNIDAVMDMNGYNLRNIKIDATVSGKWEFFYNKWLITDGLDVEPDMLINVPSRWTGKIIDGKKLNNTGYASYRLTIMNPEIGSELAIKLEVFPVAYRTFINNSLTCQNGELSKTASDSFSVGSPTLTPYKITDNEPLTVVLEVSYNNKGGLFLSPWLHDASRNLPNIGNIMSLIPILAAGMLLAFVFFTGILNIGLIKRDKNISFILLILALFFHLLTTKEAFLQIGRIITNFGIGYTVIFEMNFITMFAVMFCFFANIFLQRLLSFSKRQFCIVTLVFISCVFLFYALFGTIYQLVPIVLGTLIFCFLLYRLLMQPEVRLRSKLFSASILFLLMFTFLLEAMDNLGYFVFGLEPGVSIMSFILIIFLSISFFLRLRDTGIDLAKATILEKEILDAKHQVLKAQIKPHYIFNVMSSIQTLYRKDIVAGEQALTEFAAHLRQNVDAETKPVIPFSQEIKNIMNYVELENLRLNKKILLILDIDFSEFEIPVLSLQPLVENAIRYAEIHKNPEGFIKIISKQEDGFIIIKVIDNGKGFCISSIRKDAVGLKNTRERFRYINAELLLESTIGKGTTVTIKLPPKKEN